MEEEEEPGQTGDNPSLVLEQDCDGDDSLISTKGGYGDYTVVELKGLLRARSRMVSGKKADLVGRLRADDNDERGA